MKIKTDNIFQVIEMESSVSENKNQSESETENKTKNRRSIYDDQISSSQEDTQRANLTYPIIRNTNRRSKYGLESSEPNPFTDYTSEA